MLHNHKKLLGFTLLEILVALFIFTIVAMIMTRGLHTVLESNTLTEQRAARLAELQLALLFIEHDLEQALERPVAGVEGTQQEAFVGTAEQFTFTHGGLINPLGQLATSSLQRCRYGLQKTNLQRSSWQVLDQVATSKPDVRNLLTEVSDLEFSYLDPHGRYQDSWPPANEREAYTLPVAVKIAFTLSHWGKITQVYIIPGKAFVTSK